MSQQQRVEEIRQFYESGLVSDWHTAEQENINQFGRATGDEDWLHTDPERAARESPFGGTIAFGFWTIAMLTHLSRQAAGQDYPEGAQFGINYGFDRLRMMAPVRVGKRIRCHIRLLDVTPRGDSRILVKTENTIEIEGEDKPALVAEWLVMMFYPEQTD
ncbi:MaoC family dehydratase [Symmachiella dynata]|uniref:MaoC family dehydratase n=1 Tax=Symmachiella dynata TaxID=2527995 RepID=UPI0030ED3221